MVKYMAEHETKKQIPHNITIQDREKISITGVEDIENFDERETVLYTALGKLMIKGRELRMERLSTDDGALVIHGQIDALEYSSSSRQGSLLGRLFG